MTCNNNKGSGCGTMYGCNKIRQIATGTRMAVDNCYSYDSCTKISILQLNSVGLYGQIKLLGLLLYDITSLPSDLTRCYELMRELDVQLQVLQRHNEERCEHELEEIKRGAESGNITPDASVFRFSDDALAEQKDCSNIADEKVSLAVQAYDLVDGHIQRLDKYMKKFDEDLRRERELAGAVVAMDHNTDTSGRSGRGHESSKAGRKRSQIVAEPLSMDLDLPVDPNEPTYCFCNQVSYGEMIACDNPDCKIEWFHYGCVGIKERPKGKWYCSNCVGNERRRKGK